MQDVTCFFLQLAADCNELYLGFEPIHLYRTNTPIPGILHAECKFLGKYCQRSTAMLAGMI